MEEPDPNPQEPVSRPTRTAPPELPLDTRRYRIPVFVGCVLLILLLGILLGLAVIWTMRSAPVPAPEPIPVAAGLPR